MERKEALAKLSKLLGPRFGYRVDEKAPTKEERETAHAATFAACARRKDLEEQKNARLRALLAADVEYQKLFAEHKAAKEYADRLFSIQHRFKFTAGTSAGMFFMVKAEGDSWEEVIEKAKKI